jgi:hypothetical protein
MRLVARGTLPHVGESGQRRLNYPAADGYRYHYVPPFLA